MRRFIALAAWALATHAFAQTFDTNAPNLIVVLRESAVGTQLPREVLEPYGPVRAQMPDGRDVELATSWFRYVGDMHIRLVFDGPADLQSASPEDLDRLHLQPEEAVRLAVDNLRRTYGEPVVRPWQGGLMQVTGRADDLNSSYFLDRAFWQAQEALHPGGVVVAVPQRGGLLFAPASDETAVLALRFSAPALYAAARRTRVSSALYLFQDGRWSLFQPPLQAQ
ncbi:hypothetical protein [Ramlibacter humi]|uniref:DUF1444 family protein n=1 Tax=Ramlibacter humi TaxID=2530451 RepID=A0A4Z0CCF4_9BURK|nr:hypothetical protein [Ramlibacter humi]TFZ08582.1 hypothetical protein EZ216_05350 [Ramlibacter humi]